MLMNFLYSFNFPTPMNMNFLWNMGSSLFLSFMIQIVSGFLMSISFKVGLYSSISSKMFIINEFYLGWLLVKLHISISFLIYFLIILHVFSSIFFSIISSFVVWVSGLFIFIIFMIISFLGYCVSGGVMGYWGMMMGSNISKLLLGDFFTFSFFYDFSIGVNDFSLIKFFIYHISLSYFIIMLMMLHIFLMHIQGSSTSMLGTNFDNQSFFLVSLICDIEFNLLVIIFYFIIISLGFLDNTGEGFSSVSDKVPSNVELYSFVKMMFLVLSCMSDKFLGVLISTFIFSYLVFYWLFSFNLIGVSMFFNVLIFFIFSLFFYFLSFSNFFFMTISFYLTLFLFLFMFFILFEFFLSN